MQSNQENDIFPKPAKELSQRFAAKHESAEQSRKRHLPKTGKRTFTALRGKARKYRAIKKEASSPKPAKELLQRFAAKHKSAEQSRKKHLPKIGKRTFTALRGKARKYRTIKKTTSPPKPAKELLQRFAAKHESTGQSRKRHLPQNRQKNFHSASHSFPGATSLEALFERICARGKAVAQYCEPDGVPN